MKNYTEKDQRFIEGIIHDTFNELDKMFEASSCNSPIVRTIESRLLFPKYSSSNKSNPEKLRVSEQELRFAFVELFSKKCDSEHDYYYSIETPTNEKYVFSEKTYSGKAYPRKADKEDLDNKKGKSARFDLTIYNSNHEMICLMEFKNNDSDHRNYKKDFLKLSTEGNQCLCYFIDLIEASDSGTLVDGIVPRINKVNKEFFRNVTYIAHSLTNRGKVEKKGFDTIYDGSVLTEFKNWEKMSLFSC